MRRVENPLETDTGIPLIIDPQCLVHEDVHFSTIYLGEETFEYESMIGER